MPLPGTVSAPGDTEAVVPTARSTRTPTRSREKPEQIADELRALIVGGQLEEGESLGREPDLPELYPDLWRKYRPG